MEKSATLASLGQAHQMRPNEFAQSVEKLLAQEPAGRLPKTADKVLPERNEGERGKHGEEEEGADGDAAEQAEQAGVIGFESSGERVGGEFVLEQEDRHVREPVAEAAGRLSGGGNRQAGHVRAEERELAGEVPGQPSQAALLQPQEAFHMIFILFSE